MPHIPGKRDLLHDDNTSCKPARYMNDLSEKGIPNTRIRVETGMSKKKGTYEANMRP